MGRRAEKLILVVDDDAQIRSGLETGLELHGYRVATAGDGHQALLWLDAHRPDLIILDLVMPGRDGLSVIGELRRRNQHPQVPIVVVSTDAEAQHHLADLGVSAFLRKPVHFRPLLEAIARLLGS